MSMRDISAILFVLAGYVLGAATLPWSFPPDPSLPNVAAKLGYSTSVAHWVIVGWSILVLAVIGAVATWFPRTYPETEPERRQRRPGLALRLGELAFVGLVLCALYWPPARARFAGGLEEDYFLVSLYRMGCGEMPYRDFEFLYGPLMIGVAEQWTNWFGLSRTAYYSLYLALAALTWLAVVLILQRALPDLRARWFAYLCAAPFLLDFLGGLNWMAFRFIGPFLAIWVLAGRQGSPAWVALAGAIIGLQLAYSHDYGIAALIALVVMLLLPALTGHAKGDGRAWARFAAMICLLLAMSAGIWLAASLWALGNGFGDYLALTRYVTGYTLEQGFAQFAFYWSAHSLALFTLLAIGVAASAMAVPLLARAEPVRGDYLWLGALAYAGVALKIALQRADYLHMAVPFIPLVLVVLMRPRTRYFALTLRARPLVMTALVVAALAQAYGHVHHGRWAILGVARGIWHELTDRPTAGQVASRRPNLLGDRYEVSNTTRALALRLAEPDLAQRPVILYRGNWDLAPDIGVCPAGHGFYNILYSDPWRPLAETAMEAGMLVVMTEGDHANLERGELPEIVSEATDPIVRLSRWIISQHEVQSALETVLEFQMWQEALGRLVAERFRVVDRVDQQVILELAK